LWRCAGRIAKTGFPTAVEELEALPGVGPYTARAVASFAFDAEIGVVDANVRRVLTRLYGLSPDADVQALADSLVPPKSSAQWNQAMIDLGAVVCRARNPSCSTCPLEDPCAWANGRRPDARKRAPVPRFETTTRYARGRVVAVLRRSSRPVELGSLRDETGLTPKRFAEAIRSLERDGLVTVRGGRVVLGASERVSAAARRR
jgi:A/G-specific adenine glycosylase